MSQLKLLFLLLFLGGSEGQWASFFYQNVERKFDVEQGVTFHNGQTSSFRRHAARSLTEPVSRAFQRTGSPNQSYQYSGQPVFAHQRQATPTWPVIGDETARNSHQAPQAVTFNRLFFIRLYSQIHS